MPIGLYNIQETDTLTMHVESAAVTVRITSMFVNVKISFTVIMCTLIDLDAELNKWPSWCVTIAKECTFHSMTPSTSPELPTKRSIRTKNTLWLDKE